jgi:hypothetical protein
MSVAT